jgi:hypothetical protein
MVMVRWAPVMLAFAALGGFFGCSGESRGPNTDPAPTAGESSNATGGENSEAGEGGFGTGAIHAGEGGATPSAAGESGTSGAGGTNGAGETNMGGGGGTTVSAGSAGMGALGGSAGVAGGTGGTAGQPAMTWTCQASRYDDGDSCDCGCGITDPDCEDERVESCNACSQLGSCALAACPSNILAEDNSQCGVPAGWVCGSAYYGDGFCDCGCAVLDSDCESKTDTCSSCPLLGCARDFCATIDPEDNTICTAPPRSWTCTERLYRDGSQCDCGCGFPDPDCSGTELESCDNCNAVGSCSGLACPGSIDPADTRSCIKLPAPPGWTCSEESYGSSGSCDCGCGVQDADCRDNEAETRDNCACSPGVCPESVNRDDPTQCAPAPVGWTCPPADYANGVCHCGCGVLDVDCYNYLICDVCAGCAHGRCDRIDPMNIAQCNFEVPADWTCSPDVYEDDVCDCGCGVRDSDCLSASKSDCDACNGQGSCSDVVCSSPASTILPNDNSSCSE